MPEELPIVHSYCEFEFPDQFTLGDIESVMGEPSEPWSASSRNGPLTIQAECPNLGLTTISSYWGSAKAVRPVIFIVSISDSALCMATYNSLDPAAFMSEARSALSRRLGIEWVNYSHD